MRAREREREVFFRVESKYRWYNLSKKKHQKNHQGTSLELVPIWNKFITCPDEVEGIQ